MTILKGFVGGVLKAGAGLLALAVLAAPGVAVGVYVHPGLGMLLAFLCLMGCIGALDAVIKRDTGRSLFDGPRFRVPDPERYHEETDARTGQ